MLNKQKNATRLPRHHQKRRNKLREKYPQHGKISTLNRAWGNRKLEDEAKTLLEAAEKNNFRPIWEYQRKLRRNPQNNQKHIPKKWWWGLYAKHKTNTRKMDTMDHAKVPNNTRKRKTKHRPHNRRRVGRIEQTLQQTKPQGSHTARNQGNGKESEVSPALQHIREKAPLTQITKHIPR